MWFKYVKELLLKLSYIALPVIAVIILALSPLNPKISDISVSKQLFGILFISVGIYILPVFIMLFPIIKSLLFLYYQTSMLKNSDNRISKTEILAAYSDGIIKTKSEWVIVYNRYGTIIIHTKYIKGFKPTKIIKRNKARYYEYIVPVITVENHIFNIKFDSSYASELFRCVAVKKGKYKRKT